MSWLQLHKVFRYHSLKILILDIGRKSFRDWTFNMLTFKKRGRLFRQKSLKLFSAKPQFTQMPVVICMVKIREAFNLQWDAIYERTTCAFHQPFQGNDQWFWTSKHSSATLQIWHRTEHCNYSTTLTHLWKVLPRVSDSKDVSILTVESLWTKVTRFHHSSVSTDSISSNDRPYFQP